MHARVPHHLFGLPGIGHERHLGGTGGKAGLMPNDACIEDAGSRRLDGLGEL